MTTGQDQHNATYPAAPLLCWDIFMEGYRRLMQLGDDLQTLNKLAKTRKWKHAFDFEQQLARQGDTLLVTDSHLRIVYASSNMMAMNGYTPDEVIGKSPRMFQGPGTIPETRGVIRDAVARQIPFEAMLVNYSKNGEAYDCHIKGFPLFNAQKELVNFIAFERRA